MKNRFYALMLAAAIFVNIAAAPTRQKPYVANTTAKAADVTANEDAIFTYLQGGVDTYADGSIVNADIDSSAAILATKLNLATIAQSLTFSDSYLLDMSSVNASSTSEGIKLPQATSCSSATAEGQICWDSDDNALYIGDGTAAARINTSAVGTFNRDLAAASEIVSYTGVGFKPSKIIFFAGITTEVAGSWGITVGTGTNSNAYMEVSDDSSTFYTATTSACIRLDTASSANQLAVLSSFDADGFSLSWTKNGSPTGTINIIYLAIR